MRNDNAEKRPASAGPARQVIDFTSVASGSGGPLHPRQHQQRIELLRPSIAHILRAWTCSPPPRKGELPHSLIILIAPLKQKSPTVGAAGLSGAPKTLVVSVLYL